MALSNPTLPEITDGYEIQLHHSPGHDPQEGQVALPPFKDKGKFLQMMGANPVVPVSTACSLATTISSQLRTDVSQA